MPPDTLSYTFQAMKIGERIKEARARQGMSQQALADFLGISRGAVGNWEKANSNNPETDRLSAIAKALNVSVAWLTGENDNGQEIEPSNVRPAPNINLDSDTKRTHTIPVYGTARSGAGGSFELNTGEVVEHRSRPAGVTGEIFGLYVEGDSMAPRYEPGDLILCYAKRPVIIGRDVVVQMKIHAEGENPRAYLKRLVSMNSEQIVVESLNPAKRRTIKRSEIASLHLVLLRNEMV